MSRRRKAMICQSKLFPRDCSKHYADHPPGASRRLARSTTAWRRPTVLSVTLLFREITGARHVHFDKTNSTCGDIFSALQLSSSGSQNAPISSAPFNRVMIEAYTIPLTWYWVRKVLYTSSIRFTVMLYRWRMGQHDCLRCHDMR